MPDGGRVFVVDDDSGVRKLIPMILGKHGYEVTVSATAAEGLALARQTPPDLFILDVNLNGDIDGFEACRRLLADDVLCGTPVLFLSARTDAADQARGLDLGATGYMCKPFNAAELLARVKTCIRIADHDESGSRLVALEKELHMAARIQRSLLPHRAPEIEGLDLYGKMLPVSQVGGDYYDFVEREHDLVTCIGDVSGKGIPAALVMVMACTFLNEGAVVPIDPPLSLTALNKLLHKNTGAGIFVSMIMLRWSRPNRTMTYTGAGHEHLLVYRADEDGVEVIKAGGRVLGLRNHEAGFLQEVDLGLQPGDAVLLYTDGVTEAMNAAGEEYGRFRLHQMFGDCQAQSAEGIVSSILADVTTFREDVPQSDDITIVVVKRTE